MILLKPFFNKRKEPIVLLIASLLILLITSSNSFATHVAGGNMTYRCLGNNQYEVTLEFRRDCLNGAPGAQFDDPASIGIFSESGELITSLGNNGQLLIPFSSTDTLNEVLTTECSLVTSDICVHRTTYITTVNLPDRQGGYIMAYQRCCRNFSLNNIVEPLTMGSTYWIHITEASMQLCNNSPTFKQWPDIFICQDDILNFDHGATDLDGDSLVYELCVPSVGASQEFPRPQPPFNPPFNTVTWSAGYNVNDMMGGDPLTINSETGALYAIPNTIGQYLIGICVKEYRDGVLLSEVRRDFEFNVRACSESPMAAFEPNFYQRCDRLDINFTNNSTSDLAPIEEIDFTWYFDYPDNTLVSIQQSPSIKFPEPGLYLVALVADDGTCIDTAFAEIRVSEPDDPTANFGLNSTKCNELTEIQLMDSTITVQEILEYNWTIQANGQVYELNGKNPVLEIGDDQVIEVTLEIVTETGCNDTITKTIDVQTDIEVDMVEIGPDQEICEGESILVNAVGNFDSYLWNTGSTNSSLEISTSGVYSVMATDSCGYSAFDTMILVVRPIENTSFDYEICIDEFIEVNGIIYENAGTYTQSLLTQYGCDSTLTITLEINQPQTIEQNYVFCVRHGIVVQGVLYDTIGQFIQPFIDEYGCDGTLILNLEAESDCDYCGSTLVISRFQITVNKHDTDLFMTTIKLKDNILFEKLISGNELSSIVADYSINKSLVKYSKEYISNRYKSNPVKWDNGTTFSEKNILKYLEDLHVHDKPTDLRTMTFTYNYILRGVEKLQIGNSFSFK